MSEKYYTKEFYRIVKSAEGIPIDSQFTFKESDIGERYEKLEAELEEKDKIIELALPKLAVAITQREYLLELLLETEGAEDYKHARESIIKKMEEETE